MICSISISRAADMNAVMIVTNDGKQKDLFYCFPRKDMLFNINILTYYHQRTVGSLIALLFKDPKVTNVALHQEGDGTWVADATLRYVNGWVEHYRGEGNNPLTAVSKLILYMMLE
jgi:hypothetical protein